MQATCSVGASVLERTAEAPVSIPNTPNLCADQVRFVPNYLKHLLQGSLERALIGKLHEDSRRDIEIKPRIRGEFHNRSQAATGPGMLQPQKNELLNAQYFEGFEWMGDARTGTS